MDFFINKYAENGKQIRNNNKLLSKKFLFFHGCYGDQYENWFPWLKAELVELGAEVLTSAFPTPDNQNLASWLSAFEEQVPEGLTSNTVIVAHSCGVPFSLRLLERYEGKILSAHFAAGFAEPIYCPQFDHLVETFIKDDFNWESINQTTDRFHVYHGSNDPYIHFGTSLRLSQNLNTLPKVIRKGGHLNEAAGFLTFRELLADLFS